MSARFHTAVLVGMSLALSGALSAQESSPAQSQQEHVPPDPPTTELNHDMPYREMTRMMQMDDRTPVGKVLLDRFEWRDTSAGEGIAWNGEAWYGGDYDKLWLKTEGTRHDGETQHARSEVLWNRTYSRWWNLQAGVRHDSGGDTSREWAALGIQGTAPGFLELEATAYVGEQGRAAARLSIERDLLLTQRLILQPEIELNAYSKADRANRIGSGLSDLELGLRLRYEFRREFAAYFGMVWARSLGGTASFLRATGEDPDDLQALAGLRLWF